MRKIVGYYKDKQNKHPYMALMSLLDYFSLNSNNDIVIEKTIPGGYNVPYKDAYCLITAGGTTVARSVLNGVPAYSSENTIISPLIKDYNLSNFLKEPPKPNRDKWLNWVGYQQWTLDEVRKGLAYNYLLSLKKNKLSVVDE